ncbi:MAG: outer membrane beta-barrel protein [Thermoanaerobaculia bacterium]
MRSKSLAIALLAFAPLLPAKGAEAQIRANTVEISPFFGRFFGGQFARGSNSLFDETVDVDDANTYGLRVGYNATEMFEFEVQGSRTDTHFISHESGDVFGSGGNRLGDLRVDYLLGYGTFNFGHRRVLPYATIGAGVGRLQPSDTEAPSHDSTRFTASLGAGLKFFATPHFGFRVDGRGYSSVLNREDTCGHQDRCNDRHYLTNGEVSGGLILSF